MRINNIDHIVFTLIIAKENQMKKEIGDNK
jgi:hypothetical protein